MGCAGNPAPIAAINGAHEASQAVSKGSLLSTAMLPVDLVQKHLAPRVLVKNKSSTRCVV